MLEFRHLRSRAVAASGSPNHRGRDLIVAEGTTQVIEAKIAYARQFYNSNVMSYNTKIQVFPNVIFTRSFGFTPADFFAATEAERADVKVSFEKKAA